MEPLGVGPVGGQAAIAVFRISAQTAARSEDIQRDTPASSINGTEVAVIGTAHDRWVEQVTAVVVPNRPGVSATEIDQWCAVHPDLRGMHRPRRIEVVEALPRTGSGKLNRPELRRMFP